MPRMTKEEYAALEEEITRNPPDVDSAKARRPVHLVVVDDLADTWLRVKAEATHKTTTQIIGELVREKIAAYA